MTSPYPYMLPSEKQFSDFMKHYGIKLSTRVVLYENKPKEPYWATRVYWMFTVFGHKNVSVLDGGLNKWIAEGRPTESDADIGSEDDYKVTLNKDLVRSFEQIKELEAEIAGGKTTTQLIDARGEMYYKNGHIPVAKNLCFKLF